MSEYAVELRSVSKSYPIYSSAGDRLKELLSVRRKPHHTDYWALRDTSFGIRRGETFCIIGENGSGKSTLLQLVAGILQPTRGTIEVHGRVAALLELGSGFNPEFTGRDNVYLNAAILGLSQHEVDRKFPLIQAFAEIGDFMNQPVKTYSSGMAVRLAFAVAIHVDPEILLVDEALAVGDIYFRQRCMRKVHELRERGVTILFVSHATADIKAIGDRVLWLERGSVRELGNTEEVVSHYLGAMVEKDSNYLQNTHEAAAETGFGSHEAIHAPEIVTSIPNIDHRFGDKRAEILGITVFTSIGQPLALLEPGSSIIVRVSVETHERLALPMVGFMLRNHMGIDFSGTNTAREDFELPPMNPGDIITVDFHLQLPELYPGTFSFSPAIADGTLNSYRVCDWIDNAIVLEMQRADSEVYGFLRLPCRVELNRVLGTTPVAVPEPQLG